MSIVISLREFVEMLMQSPQRRDSLFRKFAARGGRFVPPYAKARGLIRRYVSGEATREVALRLAAQWRRRGERGGRGGPRLVANAGMVERFVRYFDMSGLERVNSDQLSLTWNNVVVRIVPDLCVVRRGRPEYTKLIYSKRITTLREARMNSIVARLIFAAATGRHPEIAPSDVSLFRIFTNMTLSGMPLDAHLERDCQQLAAQLTIAFRSDQPSPHEPPR